tara:strand:+ start:1839 stop:2153 length:315 start_codon:yes stop_codon:yes gene_type:complete
MHETVIANKIIEQAKQAGATNAIQVEVGELAELTPEEIETTLKQLTNWNIQVNYQKSEVKCSCNYQGPAKVIDRGHGYCYFKCPQCNQNPEVIKGGEIKITGVE